MGLFRKKMPHTAGEVDKNRLPRHIAIIMDGNGRWAKQRSLPRTAGHKAGAEVFRDIATYCKELGVAYLTVYAFSTENWKRPAEEVSAIMGLLKQYLLEAVDTMERDNIRLKFFGDLSAIAPELQKLAEETREISGHCDGFQANICLNYGGRAEILRLPGGAPRRERTGRRRTSGSTCTPPASLTRSSSSGPAASCGSAISCCGSARTANFISAIPCGLTSPAQSWTRPSSHIRSGTADSAA